MATHGRIAVEAGKNNQTKYKICPKCGKPIDSPMLSMNCDCKKEDE